MSGRRRLQQSKSDEKQPHTSADQGQNAVKPDKGVLEGPSAPAKAPKTTKHSKKRKAVAAIAAPAVISGLAGAVPQVTIDAAQQVVHAVTVGYPATYKPNISGGGYEFSREWQGSSSDQAAAVKMASQVVDIALRKAGWRDCDAASKRRYIQWILAGDMTPPEAAQVLVQRWFQPNIKPLRKLIRLMQKERPVSTDYRSIASAVNTQQIIRRP